MIILNTINSRAAQNTEKVVVQAFAGVYHLNRQHGIHWKAPGKALKASICHIIFSYPEAGL